MVSSVRAMHVDGPDTADPRSRAEFARRVWTTVGIVGASALIGLGGRFRRPRSFPPSRSCVVLGWTVRPPREGGTKSAG